MQLILNVEQPTAETYFQENFKNPEWDWKDIYTLPRLVTMITNICKFEYRLLHNILNEMLHKIGRRVSPLYSFLHGRAWKPNSVWCKNKLSLDADATA